MAPIDDGHAVHYTALERGTPVISSDGEEVGKVVEVLDNYREHIFDGLVIETTSRRAQVRRRSRGRAHRERAVTLTITAAECRRAAARRRPPRPAVGGALKRLFGRRR